MLKIRLSRVGRKHEPVYRLVLTESQNAAKSGRSLEVLGSYDSRNSEKAAFNTEKIKYWVSKGAQLSDTAHNLMVKKGLITGEKRNVLPKKVIEAAKAKKLEADKPTPEPTPVESVANEIPMPEATQDGGEVAENTPSAIIEEA